MRTRAAARPSAAGVPLIPARRASRLLLAAATGLVAVASLTGCGGSGDTGEGSTETPTATSKVKGADTKCSDYVSMSKADQIKVIQQTSKEIDKEDVSADQAATAVDSIKQFCQEPDLEDGTMRDIAAGD